MSDPPIVAGDLVLAADVHIGSRDDELPRFQAFLSGLIGNAATVVLLGDIFSLWLGDPKFTEAHHHAVLESCREIRRHGVKVVFVEGNREFATSCWEGDCFDEVAVHATTAAWGGLRWRFAHGDLLDRDDHAGRAFRAVIRSRPALAVMRTLPGWLGSAAADRVERSLRHVNRRHKTALPRHLFTRYADWFARRGFDAAVIGHIHVEMRVDAPGPDGAARPLFVLPDWRSTHRFLRIPPDGAARFEGPCGAGPAPPAVVAVVEARGGVTLVFERGAGLAVGARLELNSGHGDGVRRGVVLALDENDPARLVARLEPGPPVLVGDRLAAAGGAAHAGAPEEPSR